jgi:hypothetical protein
VTVDMSRERRQWASTRLPLQAGLYTRSSGGFGLLRPRTAQWGPVVDVGELAQLPTQRHAHLILTEHVAMQ